MRRSMNPGSEEASLVETKTLTKNQKKRLRKKDRKMERKKQAGGVKDEIPIQSLKSQLPVPVVTKNGDEISGSMNPVVSQIVAQVNRFSKEMMESVEELRGDSRLIVLEAAIIEMREALYQALDRKLAEINDYQSKREQKGKSEEEAGLVDQ